MMNYKTLGDYIVPVKVKNIDLKATELLGINIDKFFMPSVANVVGTDLSRYKVVEKNQFACNRMHVGRDCRIPVALSDRDEPFMVSPAYDVFEIKDTSELLPEYLMMWFSRAEFDRNAWFYTDADVRGGLSWSAFCEMKLPIPDIEKQHEIVSEYNTVKNRITINNQLIQKLEKTAQAIYKHWFVDFEFPDENGNPYKSAGGKMVWNEELEKEIPEGWELRKLEELVKFKNGKSKPTQAGSYPVYGGNGIIELVNEFNSENVISIGRVGAYCGSLYREIGKCWISDNAISGKSKIDCYMFTYYLLNGLKLNERSEGTGQPLITQGLLNSIKIVKPDTKLIKEFENEALKIFVHGNTLDSENQKLSELIELLLSKMTKVETEKEVV